MRIPNQKVVCGETGMSTVQPMLSAPPTDFRNPILDNSIADAPSIGLDLSCPPLKSCHDITLLIWFDLKFWQIVKKKLFNKYWQDFYIQSIAGTVCLPLILIYFYMILNISIILIYFYMIFNISIILIYFYMIFNISITLIYFYMMLNISFISIYFYMTLNISITPWLAQLVTLCLQQGVTNIQIFEYI